MIPPGTPGILSTFRQFRTKAKKAEKSSWDRTIIPTKRHISKI
jgi:hypothetical protein